MLLNSTYLSIKNYVILFYAFHIQYLLLYLFLTLSGSNKLSPCTAVTFKYLDSYVLIPWTIHVLMFFFVLFFLFLLRGNLYYMVLCVNKGDGWHRSSQHVVWYFGGVAKCVVVWKCKVWVIDLMILLSFFLLKLLLLCHRCTLLVKYFWH